MRTTMRALGLITILLAFGTARAATVCEEIGGVPGRETTLRIVIDAPDDGSVIPARTACGGKAVVTGSYVVEAPPLEYDFYIVIDASGSTTFDSRADVNRNGVFGERPADDIYRAEIQAAQDFIRALNAAASRVAIIQFSGTAVLRQPLTADMGAAIATLETMRAETPNGGTNYVPALEAVRLEMLARGDTTNRIQRGVFLSDGEPSDSLAAIEAKALELAALFIRIDTFALGAIDSAALRSIASITRGTFNALATPGDIVALLPSFVPDVEYTFDSEEVLSGTPGIMTIDPVAGTFQAVINLLPGPNVVTLTLTTLGSAPMTLQCTLNLTVPEPLFPDAGPEVSACAGVSARLDASRSTSICFVQIYRWLDCNGVELAGWSTTPNLDVDPCSLPCETVTLEMTCEGETCTKTATTMATCLAIAPPVPVLASACEFEATLACGVADPSFDVDWDTDPATDSDGDGDPANDVDASGCDLTRDFGAAGSHEVVVMASDPVSGCVSSERLTFDLTAHPAPRNIDGGACPDVVADFSCGTADPALTYWWDFDETVDADSNGDPTDDPDAAGCDAFHSWDTAGTHVVHGWAEDATGCRWAIAQGTLDISDVAVPGETFDLRVSRQGDAVTFSWTAVVGAAGHRVLRGPVLPLQSTGAYDHAADDAASRGACEVLGAPTFTDPDDAAGAEAYYYLVTALNSCGGEGPTGQGWDGQAWFARPGRAPSATCP